MPKNYARIFDAGKGKSTCISYSSQFWESVYDSSIVVAVSFNTMSRCLGIADKVCPGRRPKRPKTTINARFDGLGQTQFVNPNYVFEIYLC